MSCAHPPVVDGDGALAHQAALAAVEGDPHVLEPAHLAAVRELLARPDPVDPAVAACQDLLGFDVRAHRALHPLRGAGDLDGPQEGLAGGAGIEAALPAEEAPFD